MKRRSNESFAVVLVCALLICVGLTACGGDGSGPPRPAAPPPPGATTFRGNLARMTAQREPEPSQLPVFALRLPLSLVGRAEAQDNGVQVCIEGTTFCSLTDSNGAFVVVAPLSGNVVLLFTGVDFTARLALTGIPPGAVVSIRNIECSTSSGRCAPQQLDVEAPTPSALPLPNQAPVCGLATANPPVLFPPNHQMVAILIAGVSDPDGDALTITPTSVFQDEPVLGAGSGDTASDATLDPLAVRAERSGQGNGRVYTVDFVADDGHGATCTGRVQICVPHDQRPGATCVDDGAAFDSTT
jgi:hypothetical protein